MIRRFLTTLLVLAAVIVIVTLAVANRQTALLILDPFNADNPAFSIELPLFILLFAALIAGILLGGVATWLTQAKWRRTARQRTKESNRWRSEADRLMQERDMEHKAQLTAIGQR